MNGLYSPPDVDEQHRLWRANCGPTALAALLCKPVAKVRPLVEQVQGGRFLGYMHAGHLVDVLRLERRQPVQHKIDKRGERAWPWDLGLAVLQFDGPWCEPGVPYRARFRYTHTVASACGGKVVYDGNAGAWLVREGWEHVFMADLVKSTPRATGWHTSSVINVLSWETR